VPVRAMTEPVVAEHLVPPRTLVPDGETTTAAVSVLQAELNLVSGNLDAIDRKTALLLPFLGVVAGLTLPDTFTLASAVLVGAGVVLGMVSVYFVFRVLLPSDNAIGPTAQEVAAVLYIPAPAFRAGIALALAKAIDQGTTRSKLKASDFRRATAFASVAILLLVGARLLGAIPMTNQNPSSPPPSSPAPRHLRPVLLRLPRPRRPRRLSPPRQRPTRATCRSRTSAFRRWRVRSQRSRCSASRRRSGASTGPRCRPISEPGRSRQHRRTTRANLGAR